MQDKPCMIARFGSTELAAMVNYLGIKNGRKDILGYIQGKSLPWWWNENILLQMQNWSGFFPPNKENIGRFCEMMFEDLRELDILGSWLQDERLFQDKVESKSNIRLVFLEPFWASQPWTRALKGKKVLVVHPFAETIEDQYLKRDKLFLNKDILPTFERLTTIKAVQSLGGNSEFENWFDALDYMKYQISVSDYDICLLGCGAYGFPLAAFIKRSGKKAVHVGGALQLLFGIRGKRWDTIEYASSLKLDYTELPNNYWVRPKSKEKPENFLNVENGCYW